MKHLLRPTSRASIRRHSGFSLIELMVGMFIGLIVVAVTGQMLYLSMVQRSATTTGTDSMVNGSLALYEISREGARTGFGISAVPDLYGCTIVRRKSDPIAANTRVDIFSLAPVVIVDGAAGAPDTITFTSSHTKGVAIPTYLAKEYVNANTPPFATALEVKSTLGINVGDMLVIAPPSPVALTTAEIADLKTAFLAATPTIPSSLNLNGKSWCSMFQVTGDETSPVQGAIFRVDDTNPPNKLRVLQGDGNYLINRYQGTPNYDQTTPTTSRSSPYNDIPFPTPTSAYHYPVDSTLFNLGASGLQSYTFAITNGDQLVSSNTLIPVYPQIVQLQAQYGKDTDSDGSVDTWDNVTPTTNAGWKQILAVRVAVVARSAQKESSIVTPNDQACPNSTSVCWSGGQITDLNANNPGANDWKYYRYRVYETTIPFRNAIWNMGSSS
ncbi:MAG: PilW family protein [Formivibrio sp.]|nr:PilW family protein [Formivibrio sp.]